MASRLRLPTPGLGELEIRAFLNSSSIATLSSAYPLRLNSPPARTHARAAIVFMQTYGGGLVAGDHVDLHVKVRPKARLVLLTQGSTKVYKTPSKDLCTEQYMTTTLEEGAALVLLPDPVQPFKGSSYKQHQAFYIHPQQSSMVFLDWVSAGRAARGEFWEFFQWRGRNEIWSLPGKTNTGQTTPQRLLLRDNIILDGMTDLEQSYRNEMDDLGVFGTLIIRGPLFQTLGQFFLEEFKRLPRIRGKPSVVAAAAAPCSSTSLSSSPSRLIWTAASIRGFVMIKIGAKEVDEAKQWLRGMLERDGTVEREFGKHSLLSLQ